MFVLSFLIYVFESNLIFKRITDLSIVVIHV